MVGGRAAGAAAEPAHAIVASSIAPDAQREGYGACSWLLSDDLPGPSLTERRRLGAASSCRFMIDPRNLQAAGRWRRARRDTSRRRRTPSAAAAIDTFSSTTSRSTAARIAIERRPEPAAAGQHHGDLVVRRQRPLDLRIGPRPVRQHEIAPRAVAAAEIAARREPERDRTARRSSTGRSSGC